MDSESENGLPHDEVLKDTGNDALVCAVIDQLNQNINQNDSARRSILLLLGSLVAFVVLGAWFWSLALVVQLIPILIVHELGHYVAMRYFRYRNVKMFFVPLLGAAVSGQSHNVPAWKKVLVSLAGPLPGILLAIPMGVMAIAWESEFWREATSLVLLINAFNLLPLLPLDGGWVAHALYFNRQPWLEALFRVLAAGAMILIGVSWQLFFFTGFGILMLIATPVAIQNARIASALRHRLTPAQPDEDGTIPPEFVAQILDRLPATGPSAEPKPLATRVRQIFEIASTPPPTALATLALTALYLLGWIVSFGVLAAIFLWPQWNRAWSEAPTIAVAATPVIQRASQQPTRDDVDRYFVQGMFTTPAAAETCANLLTQKDDCEFAFINFGRAIIVSMDIDEAVTPAGTQLLESFKVATEEHHWFETGDTFYFQISCLASDTQAAKRLAQRADDMFLFGNDLGLSEPWSPLHQLTDGQYLRRATRRKLDAPFDAAADEELIRLSDSAEVVGSNSPAEVEDRFAEYDLAFERKYELAVREMLADETGLYDRSVIEHWQGRPGGPQFEVRDIEATTDANERQWRLELADLLGRIPETEPVGNEPDEASNVLAGATDLSPYRYSATNGMVLSDDRTIRFYYLHLRNPLVGLPAVLTWLQTEGCEQIELRIVDGDVLDDLP